MDVLSLAKKIGRNDFRLIGRDNFLLLIASFVVLITLFVRFALPALNGYLSANAIMPGYFYPLPLSHFYPLLVGFLILFQGATLSGIIYGFLLLDEKDDNTLIAMQVTPVSSKKFISVRMYIPALFAALAVFVQLQLIGVLTIPLLTAMMLATGASLTGPIVTLTYANFAQNKLQGFAIAKFIAVAGGTILIGWFVPEPAQWIFSLFPPFLINKAYWLAIEGSNFWIWPLLVGIIAQLTTIWVMVIQFTHQLRVG